jgi:uroporphyrinogen-III synthase
MNITKILVSQPRPTSEKSPYFDLERKYGVEIVFRQFIKVEGLTSKEFRQSKINVPDYSAIILTARTAVDHFFRLCNELRYKVPDTLKYFCVSETVANYLQKYVIYRKRKIFYSETGTMDGLIPIIAKHNKETYLMPVSDVHNDKTVVLDNNKVKYVKAVMYRTVSNDFKPGEAFDYDMLVFFTPAGIKSYIRNFPDYLERNVVIAAMGSTTLEEASNVGLKVDVTISPEAPSMASAIALYLKKLKAEEEKGERKVSRGTTKVEKEQPKVAKQVVAPKQASATKDDEAEKAAAEKRSAAAKKAAATRKAKADAEKEAAEKRSAAAKKAAATRKAKAEAEKATAKKATAKKK